MWGNSVSRPLLSVPGRAGRLGLPEVLGLGGRLPQGADETFSRDSWARGARVGGKAWVVDQCARDALLALLTRKQAAGAIKLHA
jgi:hypothetical protein